MAKKLTVFSAPKAFSDDHVALIQQNAIQSWIQLGPEVEILIFGDESGIEAAANQMGVRHFKSVERNAEGTPLLSSVFKQASEAATSPRMCYVNSDIILLGDLFDGLGWLESESERYLGVGSRWDLDIDEALRFDENWQEDLRLRIREQGALHPPAGSDYFLYPTGEFARIPAFSLGRAGWDNWMIYAGMRDNMMVVDLSEVVTIVHQNHGYQHLPGGQAHYRLPESRRNIALAGGRESVFTLVDVPRLATPTGLQRRSVLQIGWRRWLEIYCILRVDLHRYGRLIRVIFHPIETGRYYWRALLRKVQGLPEKGSQV